MSSLDPLLHRQLHMLGLDDQARDLTPEAWTTVLRWVSEHYRSMDEERRLLRQSYEQEVRGAYRELSAERERAAQMYATTTAAVALIDDAIAAGRQRATFREALDAVLEDLGGDDERSAALSARYGRLGENVQNLLARLGADVDAAAELARAGRLQRAWLPSNDAMVRGRFDLAGAYRSAGPCGGDWWTVRNLDARRALVVIGDATGHGAEAAMITAVARGALDVAVRALRPTSPGAVLEAINGAIYAAGEQRVQMTCAAAILEVFEGTLVAASAGHVQPYIVRARGELDQIRATGAALGSVPDARYEDTRAQLAPGDTVLWYTDGLIECEDRGGRQFGARRLRKLLERGASPSATALRDELLRSLSGFTRGAAMADDVAFAIATFRSAPRRLGSTLPGMGGLS